MFINLDDEAPEFSDTVGDAFEGVADVLGTAELEVFHFHKFLVKGNWKLWHETNMELYHEFLHYVNRRVAMGGEGYFERLWRVYPGGHGTLNPMKQAYERIEGWQQRTDKPLPGLGPGEFRMLVLFPDNMELYHEFLHYVNRRVAMGGEGYDVCGVFIPAGTALSTP